MKCSSREMTRGDQLLLGLITFALLATSQNALALQRLFEPAPGGRFQHFDPEVGHALRRMGRLKVDFTQLSLEAAERFDPTVGDVWRVAFFGGPDRYLDLESVQVTPEGRIIFFGRFCDEEFGEATLVVFGKEITAEFSLETGALYRIRTLPSGDVMLKEVATEELPPEAEPIPVQPAVAEELQEEDAAGDAVADGTSDDGSFIDVMVLYTASARSAAGGTGAMNSLIALAMSETNTGYSSSGVYQRARLVHSAEVSYSETSGFSAALSAVTATSDGNMDEIHALRTTYGADEVVLLINNLEYCGLAWLMTSVSSGFNTSAFSTVHYGCATGYYSFAHEMGHNEGSHHDRYVAGSGTGAYSYSYGYVQSSASPAFRTVMAYSNACSGCTRVNRWSNPNASYNGYATGVSSSSGSSADNRLSLNNTRAAVGLFKPSTGCSVGSNGTYIKGDFNRDGTTDIIFRSTTSGADILWGMTGANGATDSCYDYFLPVTNQSWKIVGTGDFNQDGKADLLWRNYSNGQNTVWYMDGLTRSSYASLAVVGDLKWEIVAVDDFNADSKPDLLWRHGSSGQNLIWYMDNVTRTSYAYLNAVTNLSWKVGGTGDFNQDGKTDIVWRNLSNGQNLIWYMDNATRLSYASLDTVANLNWRIVGVADYDTDGKPDLLWREISSGSNAIWYMNDTTKVSTATLTGAGIHLELSGR